MKCNVHFKLNEMAKYLRENYQNFIEFFNSNGAFVSQTYSKVYDDAVKLTYKFKEMGLARQDSIVIAGKPSYYWLVVEIACIFSGIKSIALPENFSEQQIRECLSIYDINACAADQEIEHNIRFLNVPTITLDDSMFDVDKQWDDEEMYQQILQESQFDIVVFTSGTTSKIKSFKIYPEATESMMGHFIEVFGIERNDRWLICHPFSHYSHLEYALGGLCAGYNLIISDTTTALLYFKRFRPSIFVSVPASYYYFYEQIQKLLKELPNKEVEKIQKYNRINPFIERPLLNQRFGKSICSPIHEFFGNNLKVMITGTAPTKKEMKEFFVRSGIPLYEGYGLTETGMISVNTPFAYRLNSVGRSFPGISLSRANNGVIRTQADITRVKKYDNMSFEENISSFPSENVVDTGDLGSLDEDGYLYIEGRSKEMIITTGGKKINPIKIEALIEKWEEVKQCVVVGNNRPYLISIIVLKESCTPLLQMILEQRISDLNKILAEHEKVRGLIYTDEPFSVENKLMTRSLKIIRQAIEAKYLKQIEEFY